MVLVVVWLSGALRIDLSGCVSLGLSSGSQESHKTYRRRLGYSTDLKSTKALTNEL